jgi:ABC-type antimicrobial peptide transport system permease subunit
LNCGSALDLTSFITELISFTFFASLLAVAISSAGGAFSIPASAPLAQYMESASQLETSWVFPNQRLQTSITCQLHLHWQIDPGVLSLSLLLSLSSFFLFMVFTNYRLLLVIADSRIQWY